MAVFVTAFDLIRGYSSMKPAELSTGRIVLLLHGLFGGNKTGKHLMERE